MLVIFLITQLACGIVGCGILGGIGGILNRPTLLADSMALVLVVGNSLAFLYLYHRETRRAALSWLDLSWGGGQAVRLAGPVFLLAAAGVVIVSEVNNVMLLVLPKPLEGLLGHLTDLETFPVLSPLLIVVLAPITEEVLFRGLMLRGLLAVMAPVRAIALSTMLFMILHLNPWQFPVACVLGVLTGWVYLRSRSLLLCVGLHAVQNATALFANSLSGTLPAFNQLSGDAGRFHPWWLDLFALAMLVAGVVRFDRAAPPVAPFAGAQPKIPEPPLIAPPPLLDPGAGI